MSAGFRFGPEVFSILSAFVEERTGVHYGTAELSIFEDKVKSRALEAGFDSALDYYYFLRYDEGGAAETDALTDALVVNETYFYREPDALGALIETHLRSIAETGRRPRVWCAACSTGEEALTLAMMLDDRRLLDVTTILASDISRRALARAELGEYRPRALRAVPEDVRARWFHDVGGGARLRRDLHAAIEWKRLNLLDGGAIAALGSFDAILCRNVLIYFSDATVLSVVGSLAGALSPGGHLVVGASESLMRFGTLLQCEERAGSFFYTRPAR